MARQVDIVPGTLRDFSYVLYHLRPQDEVEVMCQLPEGVNRMELAHLQLQGSDNWAVRIDGQPVAIFGVQAMNVACCMVWALGTADMWRVAGRLTNHFLDVVVPDLLDRGFMTMEARSIETHKAAHRWMKSTGAQVVGPPFEYGRDGNTFLLFRWTRSDFDRIRRKRRRDA